MSKLITVNTRILSGKVTGVQRYLSQILECWDRSDYEYACVKPHKTQLNNGIRAHLWEQSYLPTAVTAGTLWCPSNSSPILSSNAVVTVHDLVALDHPEFLSKNFAHWYQWLLPKLVKRSRHILTVSEFTKSRIIEHFKVAEEKVSVTPLAPFSLSPSNESSDIFARLNITDQTPYFFMLGSLEPRKNIARVLAAWKKLQLTDVKLVIAGLNATKDLSHVFAPVNLSELPKGVVFAGYVSDLDIISLNQRALALLYPSIYEGFGLPVMEAMQQGLPAITSINTSMQEFAKDSAYYVDPLSIDSIAQAILIAKEEASLRVSKSLLAKAYAQNYSWQQTASKTWNCLTQYG